nr:hypothetical protein [Tanacetum cinerariifolium]
SPNMVEFPRATLGLEVAIRKSWGDMKKMMMEEFYPNEERFNELVLLCPEAVPTEKKKVEAYIKGLLENIKGEENSQGGNRNNNKNNRGNYQDNNRHHQYNNQRQGNARALTNAPAEQSGYKGNKPLCNNCKKHHTDNYALTCRNYGRMGHYARDCRKKVVATGANTQSTLVCYGYGERGNTRNYCPNKNNPQGEEARERAYVIKEADKDQGPNVVMGHLFKIDLMLIELGTFDVIIGMDWLVEQDDIIVYGKKVVHVPYKNKTLVVEGDRGASRLKVISC